MSIEKHQGLDQVNKEIKSSIEVTLLDLDNKNKSKHSVHKKIQLVILIIAVLLFCCVFVWKFTNERLNSNKYGENVLNDPVAQEEFNDLVLNDTLDGKYDEAIKKINDNSKIANSSYGQEQIASVYVNADQPDKAILVLQESSRKYGLTKSTAHLIATLNQELNNKQQAIEYYQKYIGLIQAGKSYPMKDADIKEAQAKINALTGK